MIEFFMPMKPPTVTHQEKGWAVVNGKPVTYDTAEIKAAKAKLLGHLAKHVPSQPIAGPVRLIDKWCYPRGKHSNGAWKTTKPDTDNAVKLLKDCMTKAGYWVDDALVCSEVNEKFWADVPGIYIRVEELT